MPGNIAGCTSNESIDKAFYDKHSKLYNTPESETNSNDYTDITQSIEQR